MLKVKLEPVTEGYVEYECAETSCSIKEENYVNHSVPRLGTNQRDASPTHEAVHQNKCHFSESKTSSTQQGTTVERRRTCDDRLFVNISPQRTPGGSLSSLQIQSTSNAHKKHCQESLKTTNECGTCHYETNSLQIYTTHLRMHSPQSCFSGLSLSKEYTCELCSKHFKTYDIFKSHRLVHFNTPLFCYVCDETFNSSDMSIVSHMVGKHRREHVEETSVACLTEKTMTCVICFIPVQQDAYDYHIRMHLAVSQNEELSCSLCSSTFFSSRELKQHFRIMRHNQEKKKLHDLFVCTSCQLVFPNRDGFAMHFVHTLESANNEAEQIQQHINDTLSHGCPICDHTVHSFYDLGQHILTVHMGSTPKEDTCSDSILSSENACSTIITTSTPAEIIRSSSTCPLGTELFSSQTKHSLISSDGFSIKQELSLDRFLYSAGDIYCKFCFQKFNSPEELALHMMTHKKKKASDIHVVHKAFVLQSMCTLCDKNFSQRDDLAMHVMTEHANSCLSPLHTKNIPETSLQSFQRSPGSKRPKINLARTFVGVSPTASYSKSPTNKVNAILKSSSISSLEPCHQTKRPDYSSEVTKRIKMTHDANDEYHVSETHVDKEMSHRCRPTIPSLISFKQDRLQGRPPQMAVNPLGFSQSKELSSPNTLLSNNQQLGSGLETIAASTETYNDGLPRELTTDNQTLDSIMAFVNENHDNLTMCRFCKIVFVDRTTYYLHMGLHNVNNPWQCNYCGYVCRDVHQFSSHVIHRC